MIVVRPAESVLEAGMIFMPQANPSHVANY